MTPNRLPSSSNLMGILDDDPLKLKQEVIV